MSASPVTQVAQDPLGVRIHPSAIVEDGVTIGQGSSIWDNVHLRGPSRIGRNCIIGEKTYVAYGVRIGDYVKINAMVYIPTGVTIEDRSMIAAGVIFTNDRTPRAFADGHEGLAPSGPTEDTLETFVREGASIGAGAVIGPGLTIGRFAMIGMGSVVTKDVPDHAMAYGNPARVGAYVCICGEKLSIFDRDASEPRSRENSCSSCGRTYTATRVNADHLRLELSRGLP